MKTVARRIAAVLTMGAAIAVALPAADASAINRVDCAGRSDFTYIYNYNNTQSTCWANYGLASVTLYNVDQAYGGANWAYVNNSYAGWTAKPWSWVTILTNGQEQQIDWIDLSAP